jgi:hypothetical protein
MKKQREADGEGGDGASMAFFVFFFFFFFFFFFLLLLLQTLCSSSSSSFFLSSGFSKLRIYPPFSTRANLINPKNKTLKIKP